MVFRQLKIRNKNHSLRKFLRVFVKVALAISAGAFIITIPMLIDREAEIPFYPKTYSTTPFSCVYEETAGTLIKFKFQSSGLGQYSDSVPDYSIREIPEKGKTDIVFNNTSDLKGEFTYNDVVNDPLIERLDYYIKDGKLIVEITRRNAYLPAQVTTDGSLATILLPPGNDEYPAIANQKPADNSAAFPALHPITFDAALSSPLYRAYVIFDGKPVQFSTDKTATSTYSFSFDEELKIDTDYTVKALITDSDGRTSISSWEFTGQIPSAAILGKDRFKYLGWWGQIAASGVTVRKSPSISSDKSGSLSSAERVKVTEEIFGEWVDGKNLWYKIDGGKYAGDYVFSDYVTPMEQPAPPKDFTIPDGIKEDENWIDVNLTKKILTLFKYDKPLFSTYISPGRQGNPTQAGTFRIWYKLKKADMQGGPPLHSYYYYLTDIPWTMFYNYDYAIHGTYWHDKFGTPQSAGCTNMTQGDAKYIFDNTLPAVPDDKVGVFARDANNKGTGTVVYNHN